jgi:DNA polymerase-3 subunit epsilon
MDKNFRTRNLAIIDLETTGLDPTKHEIVEVGMLIISQPNLEIIETYEAKVKPLHIETATDEALKINSYNEKEWKTALDIEDVLREIANKTEGCIICNHNVSFDWSFLQTGFIKYNIKHSFDYHMYDIASMIWLKLSDSELTKLNLNITAEFLGIEPEPSQHRALNGAMVAYRVLKALKEL